VTRELDGRPLDRPPFELRAAPEPAQVVCGPRIGLSRAAEVPWRYGLAGSRFLSRPFRVSA
jgi:DNA-3-methyladenine glycosylase